MKVTNAIEDVVFKYLMEDKRIAKQIFSALLRMKMEDEILDDFANAERKKLLME